MIPLMTYSMSFGNLISQYINEICFSLAQESVLVIGNLAIKFPERINAILMLFTSIINNGKTYLFDNMAISLKQIFIRREYKPSKELEDLILGFDKLVESIKGEEAKMSILWLLAKFSDKIDLSVYLIENYVNQLEEYDIHKSECLKLEVSSQDNKFNIICVL
jgi:hypothetical protein